MAIVIHCPKLSDVNTHLEPLLGRSTKVVASKAANKFEASCFTARYVTRDDKLAALAQFELPLAACAAASLAMIPMGTAEEAVKAGKLPENLLDAFREVANILAGILCADGSPHVRWTNVATSQAELTAEDKALLAKPANRLDVTVEVEGYGGGGGGKLTFVTAKR